MIKIEDIIFWIIIISIIAIALWLLSGSPPESDALITIALFMAASELLVWKKIFSMDKNTAISFVKLKNDMNNRFNNIDNKLNEIHRK